MLKKPASQPHGTDFANEIMGQQAKQPGQPKAPITAPPLSGPGSGVAPANLPSNIAAQPPNPYVPGPCDVNSGAGNVLSGATPLVITFPAGSPTVFDNLVIMPKPAKRIMITSISYNAGTNGGPPPQSNLAGLWLSLQRMGLGENGTPFLPVEYFNFGTEVWIPLLSQNRTENSAQLEGTIIEFRYPVQQFFIHATATTSNQTVTIEFAVADDIVGIEWKNQQN